MGYLNDSRTKTIVVEKKSRIVRLAFEKYTKGNMRLEDVSNFLAKSGVTTRTGKRISKTKASFILSNPFYIGLFKYGGEIHEGKHEPIISKKLLMKHRKCCGSVDNLNENHRMNLNHFADSFPVSFMWNDDNC